MANLNAAPVKGSWEDLLSQAQLLASNLNDDAIPLYQKLVARLLKLPREQRVAADRRLQTIWEQAALELHDYLTMRERYDEALSVLDLLIAEYGDADIRGAMETRANMLLADAGRLDEAIVRLRAKVDSASDELDALGQLYSLYLRQHRVDDAAAVIDEIESHVRTALPHKDKLTEEQKTRLAYVAFLRFNVAIQRKDWPQAMEWYETGLGLDERTKSHVASLYMNLVRDRQFEDALRYISRDLLHPVRAGFWHGLALYYQGRLDEARRQWQTIVEIDLAEAQNAHLLEYFLARFYLGDADGYALSTVLQALQEQEEPSWPLFFLAGLGWGQRGNLANARSNLELAMLYHRAGGAGRLLPAELWHFCCDLLSPESQASTQQFFEHAP